MSQGGIHRRWEDSLRQCTHQRASSAYVTSVVWERHGAIMEKLMLDMNWCLGRLRRIYFMALPESEADYEKSRRRYIVGDSAAQTIAQLAGGTFLVSLMLSVGFSDAQAGILTSVASLAAIFQLFTMGKVSHLKKRKLFICLMTVQKLYLAFIFFIPLLPAPNSARQLLMIAGYFVAQICAQVGTPATQDWIASLVPARLRGNYFSRKDAICVFVTVTMMLLSGILMDATAGERQNVGFTLNGSMILILVLLNAWAFSCMKEPRQGGINAEGKEIHGHLKKKYLQEETAHKGELLAEIKEAFGKPDFRMAFAVTLLWQTSYYCAAPFNTSYQLKELGMPFTFIMVISFLGNMLRIAITPRMGRMGDKYGMAFLYKYSLVGILMCFVFFSLAVPANAYPMVIAGTVCSALGWSFAGIGLFGVQLELLDEGKRDIQLSILSSLSGVYGFLVSFAAGQLLDFLQRAEVMLAGRRVYAQQFTNILGAWFLVLTIVYIKFKVQKRERQLG